MTHMEPVARKINNVNIYAIIYRSLVSDQTLLLWYAEQITHAHLGNTKGISKKSHHQQPAWVRLHIYIIVVRRYVDKGQVWPPELWLIIPPNMTQGWKCINHIHFYICQSGVFSFSEMMKQYISVKYQVYILTIIIIFWLSFQSFVM